MRGEEGGPPSLIHPYLALELLVELNQTKDNVFGLSKHSSPKHCILRKGKQ